MDQEAVRCQDLRVVRGGTQVLRDLTFTVPAAAVTGLLGPSGCGKTTLMRAIVGTQIIRSGRITVLGQPAGDRSLRTRIGYSSQAAAVYPDLTVAENIRYFASAVRARDGDVDRVLGDVRMSGLRDRLTGRLSGGERSRVSLAVALLGSPGLLILDEPTVGLDPVLREDLWTLFRQRAAEGLTVLVSSHVMDEADRCDALVLLREGRIIAHDTPAALRERTRTTDMNAAFLALIAGDDR